jgi:hypothetical protein
MKRLFVISVISLLTFGCSNIAKHAMQRKTGKDADVMVQRYKEASVSQVETVLRDYLALTDDYERRGWEKYGRSGWIDYLRAMCEARLAIFYKATGQPELYRQQMNHAITHLKTRYPDGSFTEEKIVKLIDGLDSANIQPKWRKEIAPLQPVINQPPAD